MHGPAALGTAWAPAAAPAAVLQTHPPPPPVDPPPLAAVPCFAAGTLILTTIGERPVEALAAGDTVVLAEGDVAPVVWTGGRDLDLRAQPAPPAVQPVRIAAGALAGGVPARELVVSPDHGLYFDGSLVPARDLVDGVTIVQDFTCPAIRYCHVELAAHGILLAEGAGSESYLDIGQRVIFTGRAALPPLPAEMALAGRRTGSIAPFITGGAALAAVRARLHGRKLMLGFSVVEMTQLALRTGETLHPPAAFAPGGIVTFAVASLHAAVLCCGVFIPAEIDPASPDRRHLGVAVAEVLLDGRMVPVESVLEPADLHRRAPGEPAVWTRGAARLTIPPGVSILTLRIHAYPRVWHNRHLTG